MKAPNFLPPINGHKIAHSDFPTTNNPTPAGPPSVLMILDIDQKSPCHANFNDTLTPKNVEHVRNFREEEDESGPIYLKDTPGGGV